MAEALLVRELAARGAAARVRSGGTRARPGYPATDESIRVMQSFGLDIAAHRSRPVESTELEHSDLIVTMTRGQLRDLATRAPGIFPRLFTVKEFARRASDADHRGEETVRDWAARLGASRPTSDLVGSRDADDIKDPIGKPLDVYNAVARELSVAITQIVRAGWPPAPVDA